MAALEAPAPTTSGLAPIVQWTLGPLQAMPPWPRAISARDRWCWAPPPPQLVLNHINTSGSYTVSAALSGVGSVVSYAGTTVLSNANSYTGGTAINGGTLRISADNNLGAASGPLSFGGGTLATTASFSTGRTTTLNAGGG